jgi:hypothetical protein
MTTPIEGKPVRREYIRQRWLRFCRWWAAVRHVPHSRSVWCGDMLCPYAEESKR